MPWYDYRCDECTKTFEARMPVARRDEAACPDCGSRRVARAFPLHVTVLRPSGAGEPMPAAGCCGGACGLDGDCACAADEAAAFV